MSTPLLKVENLKVTFPPVIQAVRGVSFSVGRGEILGIVGESGSGKSVSTAAVPALLPPHALVSGSIMYDGVELAGMDQKKLRDYRGKKIGIIFQEPGRSYDPLQAMGSVFFETLRNCRPAISREESDAEAERLLLEVGLSGARERLVNFPHQFSGGQLQRVGIALALAQGCDLLIADEPTTALDVTIQAQIVELLKCIRDKRKIAILFISHNIDLVAEISDRIMVMYGGLVMESGPAEALVSAPFHPYTAALLAAAPQFGSHYSEQRLRSIPGRVPDPAHPESGCPFAPRCVHAVAECAVAAPALQSVVGKDTGEISGGRFYRCIQEPGSLA